MLCELANNDHAGRTNNHGAAFSFDLPDDIDVLIDASETYSPEDIWMVYLATLPLDTPTAELHRIKPLFIMAVTEYVGEDE
ncbi:hypothetical protein ABKY47_002059 [Aeromonas hydrophila]